jgi:ABC-type maltose transport system permease subunit
MDALSFLITGVLVALVGFFGLVMASHAAETAIYLVGLAFFAFAVLFDFWLIKRWFDSAPQRT